MNTLDGLLRETVPRAIVSEQAPLVLNKRSAPQPDVALLRARADGYFTSLPVAADVLVVVVEVADTTLEYDLEVKCPLYAQAGVAELWIIDVGASHAWQRPREGAPRATTAGCKAAVLLTESYCQTETMMWII